MRTICFRAKSVNTSEWLYGDLEYNKKKSVARIHSYEQQGEYIGQQEVDDKTIGQYTGLRDMNGVEIYEGDVVDWTFFYRGYTGTGGAVECDTQVKGIIEWHQGGFILNFIENDFEYAGQYSISSLNTDTEADVVVVGNIFDDKQFANKLKAKKL